MTRQGPRRKVDARHWIGRRDSARAFHQAARDALERARPVDNCAPAVVSIVSAAIAYADAIAASKLGVVNKQDHQMAGRLLREALGNALPAEQERRFRNISAVKDEAQYGATTLRLERAQKYLNDLDAFARWAEDQLPAGG